MTEVHEREQALLDQGQASKELLESAAFLNTLTRLSDAYSQGLFATTPQETKTRETYYYKTLVLNELMEALIQDVSVANEIIESRNEAN